MIFRRSGFTLLELMVVMAIIGIIAAALFPQMSFYYARGRDVARISDAKSMSSIMVEYSRLFTTYPSTTSSLGVNSNCISDMFTWTDAVLTIKDKQFSQLSRGWQLKTDPTNRVFGVWYCAVPGSYFYNLLNWTHGVVAARMEIQTTGANYNTIADLLDDTKIDDLIKAKPLDKNVNDPDKLFTVITN